MTVCQSRSQQKLTKSKLKCCTYLVNYCQPPIWRKEEEGGEGGQEEQEEREEEVERWKEDRGEETGEGREKRRGEAREEEGGRGDMGVMREGISITG